MAQISTAGPRLTVLQPDVVAPLGRFTGWFAEAGVVPTVHRLWEDPIPEAGALGDGLVVLGGRMNVHAPEEHPWIEPVKALVRDAAAAGLPVLGICLGHQLVSEALGGSVTVAHPGGREQCAAVLEWLPAAASDPVLGGLASGPGSTTVAFSHGDVVTRLPEGALELCRTARYQNQAFRLGSVLGVQFHPEASPQGMVPWAKPPTPERIAALVSEMESVDDAVVASGRAIAHAFAAQVLREGALEPAQPEGVGVAP